MGTEPNAAPGANGESQEKDRQELIDLVNQVVTSQVKRHLKDVVTTQSLKSVLEEFRTSFAPQPEAAKDDGKSSDEVTSLKKRLEEVARKNEEVEKRYMEAQQRVEQAERKRAEDKARADLRHLISGGLDPKLRVKDDLIDVAVGYLVDSKKVLKFDEDGGVKMSVLRYVKGLDPDPQDLDLDKAVTEWFKSPESRTFVAAQPLPGGSGQKTSARPAPAPVLVNPSQTAPTLGGVESGVARFME